MWVSKECDPGGLSPEIMFKVSDTGVRVYLPVSSWVC